MTNNYYPLTSFISAVVLAQGVKPFIMWPKTKKFKLSYAFNSGGYPSSHSAGVTALTMAIGLKEGFDSSFFAICCCLTAVVVFDAFNVRWYAGRNIKLTKQLVEDLQDYIDETDPIYNEKLKDVLGHTKLEILTGLMLGIYLAIVLYLLWR